MLVQIQLLKIYDVFQLNNSGNWWFRLGNKQRERHRENLNNTGDFSPHYRWHKRLPPGGSTMHPHRQYPLVGLTMIQALQGSLPLQKQAMKEMKKITVPGNGGLSRALEPGSNWIKLLRRTWEGLQNPIAQAAHLWHLPASPHQVLSERVPAPVPAMLNTKERNPFPLCLPISTQLSSFPVCAHTVSL